MDLKEKLSEYLTFYHECLIPQNDFFTSDKNKNNTDSFIVVSSPSRMGNHALLSLIDNHPDLPRIAGEDEFLKHSFFKSTYDFNSFINSIKGGDNINFIRKLSSIPGDTDKWEELYKMYIEKKKPKVHAGIQYPTDKLVVADYQDIIPKINYSEYINHLENKKEEIVNSDFYSKIFLIYLEAIAKLDFNFKEYKYKAVYPNSGMRRQCLWLCQYFSKVKIICSIREFKSYAISHIRSRYKVLEFKKEYIEEAWEHWYHKIIDYYFIKTKYPDNIMLIPFKDISKNTELVANNISDFLKIQFNESMLKATIFGNPVKGNSSKPRDDKLLEKFYQSNEFLPENLIPDRVKIIEEALEIAKY